MDVYKTNSLFVCCVQFLCALSSIIQLWLWLSCFIYCWICFARYKVPSFACPSMFYVSILCETGLTTLLRNNVRMRCPSRVRIRIAFFTGEFLTNDYSLTNSWLSDRHSTSFCQSEWSRSQEFKFLTKWPKLQPKWPFRKPKNCTYFWHQMTACQNGQKCVRERIGEANTRIRLRLKWGIIWKWNFCGEPENPIILLMIRLCQTQK